MAKGPSNGKKQPAHYFFRFGKKNAVFDQIYELIHEKGRAPKIKCKSENKTTKTVRLAVYWSAFKKDDYIKGSKQDFLNLRENAPKAKRLGLNELSQAKLFFEAEKGSIFWLYLDNHVVGLMADDDPNDQGSHVKDELKQNEFAWPETKLARLPAKCRSFSVKGIFVRNQIPELFATIDSSGSRATITNLSCLADGDPNPNKLENVEIGNALIRGKKITVPTFDDSLRYLSPVQLETLIFKLFDGLGFVCSAYRGASKYGTDLIVLSRPPGRRSVKSPFPGRRSLPIAIQVKRTIGISELKKQANDSYNHFLVTIDGEINRSTPTELEKLCGRKFVITRKSLSVIVASSDSSRAIRNWVKGVLGDHVFTFGF